MYVNTVKCDSCQYLHVRSTYIVLKSVLKYTYNRHLSEFYLSIPPSLFAINVERICCVSKNIIQVRYICFIVCFQFTLLI